MKLLLDTHIWIWSLLDPDRLSLSVRQALETDENELWLSPVSVWETLLLLERGRLSTSDPPHLTVARMLIGGPFREAPLTHAVAAESRRLDLSYDDPTARFIAATAVVHALILVTGNRRLMDSDAYSVLSNT